MASHTPEWEVWVSDDQQFVSVGPVYGGCAVAEIVISDSAGIIRQETRVAGMKNARLMAAAPELAEALKGLLDAYPSNGSSYPCQQARAALRKAGL